MRCGLFPDTAVNRSSVIVPIAAPTLIIFVDAKSEDSVVTTRVRAIGSAITGAP